MVSKTENYKIISVPTKNPSLGVIIVINDDERQNELSWEKLESMIIKTEKKESVYNEVWIPGFNCQCNFEPRVNLNWRLTNKIYLMSLAELGIFELYTQPSHKGRLLLSNTERRFIIDNNFIFCNIELYK